MKTSITFSFTNSYGATYSETLNYSQLRDMVRSAKSPHFMLARRRNSFCGYPSVLVYRRQPGSPSGKMLDGSGPAFIMDRLIRKYQRTSALSPTEMLTGAAYGY